MTETKYELENSENSLIKRRIDEMYSTKSQIKQAQFDLKERADDLTYRIENNYAEKERIMHALDFEMYSTFMNVIQNKYLNNKDAVMWASKMNAIISGQFSSRYFPNTNVAKITSKQFREYAVRQINEYVEFLIFADVEILDD